MNETRQKNGVGSRLVVAGIAVWCGIVVQGCASTNGLGSTFRHDNGPVVVPAEGTTAASYQAFRTKLRRALFAE